MMVGYNEYVTLFSGDHILFVLGLSLFGFLLFYFRHSIKQNRETVTKWILFVSLLQQILLYSSYFFLTEFDISESLPMHISRISTILGIIYLFNKNEKLIKILFYFSLYAWISFIYPSQIQSFFHPLGVSFFVNHTVTLLLPFYAMIAYDARITPKDKNMAFRWFLLFLGSAYCVNILVDGNYFYLVDKPIFASTPDFIYIPGVVVFAYLLFSVGEAGYSVVQKRLDLATRPLLLNQLSESETKPRKIQ